jgi:hypothetical protein
MAQFGLTDFSDREKLVTDGKYDGGIDAYFVDQPNKRIYLLQSKFRATATNFSSRNMGAGDLLKMDVKRIVRDGQKHSEAGEPYNPASVDLFPVSIRYLWPEQLDAMADDVGLRLRDRFADWRGSPFTESSGFHISVYEPAS